MKIRKHIVVAVSFIIFSFVCCMIWGLFFSETPELLEPTVKSYKTLNGLFQFARLLPVIMGTGFFFGFSLEFGKHSEGSLLRFSTAMFQRYRMVMIISIFLTMIITLSKEVGVPAIVSKQQQLAELPDLEREYKFFAESLYENGRYELAYRYAELAYDFDKEDAELKILLDKLEEKVKNEVHMISNVKPSSFHEIIPSDINVNVGSSVEKNENYMGSGASESEKPYTSFNLMKLAQEHLAKEDYFGAHYYSQLAISISNGRDINLQELKHIAAESWNKLNETKFQGTTEDQKTFAKKLEGYISLLENDNLKAYYIFRTLSLASKNNSLDPDIIRYLEIAEQRIQKQYFFTDETLNLQRFEGYRNIYFKIPKTDGSTDIYFIKGVTTAGTKEEVVQYLRGLSIFNVDENGNYISSSYTPYAKMIRLSTAIFDEGLVRDLEIPDGTKFVPYVMLRSVDRDVSGKINSARAMKSTDFATKYGFIILPFEYSTFETFKEASGGINSMNLFSIYRLKNIAMNYGYSQEVCWQALFNGIFYPFYILSLLVYIGVLGWHCRIPVYEVFRFKWIFAIPLYAVLFYMVYEIFIGLFKILNYSFLSIVGGTPAFFIAVLFYSILLIMVSLKFLSCKNSMAL